MIRFGRHKPSQVPARRSASKPGPSRRARTPEPEQVPEPEQPEPERIPEPESRLERESAPEPELASPSGPETEDRELPSEHDCASTPVETTAIESATDSGFAGDEERFFNEPEISDGRLATAGQDESQFSSIAPTVTDSKLPDQPRDMSTALAGSALENRRRRLRGAVLITLCASAAILLLGISRRPALGIRAKANAAPAHVIAATTRVSAAVPAIPPAAAPAPSDSAPGPALVEQHISEESARALVRSARALLEAGKIRAGVTLARQALAANGSDAEPYILLAAGLQDLGDWSGAQSVFAECRARAQHGSHADCSYFLAQKH